MIEVHVWFYAGTANEVRITIPMDDNDTAGDLKQTIDQPGLTPFSGVGAAAINLWDRPGGNLVPDAQQLADDDEFDATLANGFVGDH